MIPGDRHHGITNSISDVEADNSQSECLRRKEAGRSIGTKSIADLQVQVIQNLPSPYYWRRGPRL